MSHAQNRRLSIVETDGQPPSSTDTPALDHIHQPHHQDEPRRESSPPGDNDYEPHIRSPLLHEASQELLFPESEDTRAQGGGENKGSGEVETTTKASEGTAGRDKTISAANAQRSDDSKGALLSPY